MKDTLTIADNRTGKEYEIPITNSTIRAVDLRQIKVDPDEFGMMSYDPAFLNTAACQRVLPPSTVAGSPLSPSSEGAYTRFSQ